MASWAYTFDADLDVVLQAARNDELEPLVRLLDQCTSGKALRSCPEYQRFYPDHRRYVHLISVKLRALGGSTFGNMLRLGQGPSYLEVVQDVARHLKVTWAKSDSLVELELKLLNHVFASCYQDMSAQEQQELSVALPHSTALVAPGGDLAQLNARERFLVASLVVQAVGKVVGLSLETWSAVNTMVGKSWTQLSAHIGTHLSALLRSLKAVGQPDYQILVPCVLHIASLRLMQAGTKLNAPERAVLPEA